MMPHTLNIVLAADNAYAPHVETLLKSLCCHNRQMRVYLFHRNSHAPEWFDYINQQLHNFDSEIISAVVSQTQLDHYPNQSHITSAAYYRFLMATLPHDRALYLDSDLLVTGYWFIAILISNAVFRLPTCCGARFSNGANRLATSL
ncbi:hypothetical protein MIS46_06375 [Wielerella bovis]|uniref:glycosyltransferase n=1 Tax=Wielerella bovis TaxID=2917790 RepID=UPI002019518F|nr:glycosyltransferase [Wielerella bovis]ULJ61634.1 hypothetical protein MIS46_06375 [Wielerella bovis]